MFNLFNNNQQQTSSGYVSDYPPVFFTNSQGNNSNSNNYQNANFNQEITYTNNYDQNNQFQRQQGGFLSSLLNSDIIKQLLPLLLGGKINVESTNSNGTNILSLIKNFAPNMSDLLKMFGSDKKKYSQSLKANSLSEDDNIIDMTNYEEVTD